MYRWDPEDYSKHSSAQESWARELISKLRLKGGERVLDIGCGDGKVTAQIADCLPEGSVLGIDSSPDMIDFARNSSAAKAANMTFECIDVRGMDFTGEFDVVFSNAALHWVPDHAPVLRRIERSLKSSGKILLQMAGKGNASAIVDAMGRLTCQGRWSGYFREFSFPYVFYGDEHYRSLVEAAGFVPVRIEFIPKTMTHNGREGLTGWIRTTWLPYIERIPVDLRDNFIEALTGDFEKEHPPDEEGFFHIKMVRLEVEAVKKSRSKSASA